MNNIDKNYQALLQDILDNGVEKQTRNGKTLSVFGRTIRHKMSEGFPLLTTKKMAWKSIVTELLWFLKGDTNIRYLVQNDCSIWNGDAYKRYREFVNDEWNRGHITKLELFGLVVEAHYDAIHGARYRRLTQDEFIKKIKMNPVFAGDWGDLGKIYGAQWRKWGGRLVTKRIKEDNKLPYSKNIIEGQIDQIQNLIDQLKTNPDSRRMLVNSWNVGELDQMVLPPCHYSFQVYTRELDETERVILMDKKLKVTENLPQYYTEEEMIKYNIPTRAISLIWNQRSVDTFLGLPFNIASYGLLLLMLADEVNMVPDELIGNLGDTHLYADHIDQAREQIGREPYLLPTVHVRDGIYCSSVNDIILENYQSHPAIKAPLSN